MSTADESEPQTSPAADAAGVLAKLPRTRPQRSTPRRAQARATRSASELRSTASELAPEPVPAVEATSNGLVPENGNAPAIEASAPAAKPSPRKRAPRARSSASKGTRSSTSKGAHSPKAHSPKAKAGTRSARATSVRPRATAAAPAPRQGYECEGERSGRTIQPPGGAELVASAAEIVGELAKAGLSAGERALKDVFSRLPF
jgi:hypothetical protein